MQRKFWSSIDRENVEQNEFSVKQIVIIRKNVVAAGHTIYLTNSKSRLRLIIYSSMEF